METQRSEQKGISKHTLILILCCLIPLALIAVLWAVGISESYLILGVLLLCPLLHTVIMRGIHKDGEDDH